MKCQQPDSARPRMTGPTSGGGFRLRLRCPLDARASPPVHPNAGARFSHRRMLFHPCSPSCPFPLSSVPDATSLAPLAETSRRPPVPAALWLVVILLGSLAPRLSENRTVQSMPSSPPSPPSAIPSSSTASASQSAPLRTLPGPTSYQSHSSTPRTSVSRARTHGKARAQLSRSPPNRDSEHDSTSTDDFFHDDDDEDDDAEDAARRPFLQHRPSSASSSRRGRTSTRPGNRRSNSIKMKRSHPQKLNDQYRDDETAAKSAGALEASNDSAAGSSPRGESAGAGEGARGPSDVTLDDLFDPTKTLQENKSMMISAELDRMGMGRYQICIWFLCGCGYFIDLLWAQALGLIVTQVAYEFDGQIHGATGPLQTAFSTGLTVGAFFFGFAVDVVGRRWSFYLTTLIASVFGIASGGARSFDTLCVLAAFIGNVHEEQQHGLALYAVYARVHYLAHLCGALLRVQVPRVAAVPACAR
ncbi:hypothetical protein L1887_59542 [Cichorium endivia]|nr:hypothetical protein L1887_59542 [Cichorium endivia]